MVPSLGPWGHCWSMSFAAHSWSALGHECQGRATGSRRRLFLIPPPSCSHAHCGSSQFPGDSPGPLRPMGSLSVGDRQAEHEAPSLCSREWSALCAGPVCTPKAFFDGKPASSPDLQLRRSCGSSLSQEQLAGEHVVSSQASGQPRLTQNAGHPHSPQRWCPQGSSPPRGASAYSR